MQKTGIHVEGKTKILHNVEGEPDLVIVETKKDITANDDPKLTKEIDTKPISSTTTTCRVFEILEEAGIPVAYRKQVSPTEFLTEKADMVALEVIVRRYIVPASSYLKRQPDLEQRETLPLRFPKLVVEFFLKTSGGSLKIGEKTIVEGLDPDVGEEDPFIINPYESDWKLFHAKKPGWTEDADLKRTVKLTDVVPSIDFMHETAELAKKAFLVLEGAWRIIGYRLIDFKIEVTRDGKIGDVIDNDSWRLVNPAWEDVSKQAFRDGEELSKVEGKYQRVAMLSERFRIPNVGLVLWAGSESDELPKVPDLPGIDVETRICSGHKKTKACLALLTKLEAMYAEGGVILTFVGRSNGLGPILAGHTSWPVVAVPMTYDKFPEDIHSSVHMPSNIPMGTTWDAKNAVLYALNILAQISPVAYMHRQLMIESLDI